MLALTRSFNGMLGRLESLSSSRSDLPPARPHELKTPLAVIKSALQVLEMAPHPSEADYREFMADTGESLERIIKTVDGLLSLANPKEVPMDETVELRPVLDLAVPGAFRQGGGMRGNAVRRRPGAAGAGGCRPPIPGVRQLD